jgi:hypothetical protein
VVTVPPSGTPPELLFARFLSVLGLTTDDLCMDSGLTVNPSLGTVEAEFLRRINPMLRERLGPPYSPVVRELVAEGILAPRRRSDPIELPRPFVDWFSRRSADLVAELRDAHYDVIGDLDELLIPPPPREEYVGPHQLPPRDIMPTAYDVVSELTLEVIELRQWIDVLQAQVRAKGEDPVPRPVNSHGRIPVGHEAHGTGPAYLVDGGDRPGSATQAQAADAYEVRRASAVKAMRDGVRVDASTSRP